MLVDSSLDFHSGFQAELTFYPRREINLGKSFQVWGLFSNSMISPDLENDKEAYQ